MTNPAKSPDRHTFQADGYIKRCAEEGKEPNENYLNMYRSARQQDEENRRKRLGDAGPKRIRYRSLN